jgi:transcriptional regulator with XRE-family HTH domain
VDGVTGNAHDSDEAATESKTQFMSRNSGKRGMTDDYRARLIARRKKLGLSRRQMAAKLLTPLVTYEQWETGARRTPGVAVSAAEAAGTRHPKTTAVRNSGAATIRGLADGSRTAAEVAAAAGVPIERVHKAAYDAKKAGRPLTFAGPTRRREPKSGRNAAIADAIRKGSTLAAQAAKYGITRQAVHQVTKRYGIRASALRRKELARRAQWALKEKDRLKRDRLRKRQRFEKQLIDMRLSGLTYKEISDRMGLSVARLTKVFRDNSISRPHVKRDPATRTMIARRWSDGEDAEQLAAEFKTTAGYVRTLAYGLGFRRRGASSLNPAGK